ncbi:MAG: TetR/AcrR family transcriptional regulator [candidate division Zixibacteria bacterium]|nr:TetR/AcrR family transcriptional regulator [candidate division Zixibacteria bacterium]
MPPKVKYTKNDVIEAAFVIAEKKGLNSLTARSIANQLGSSTAPVYMHFESMDELTLEIVRKIKVMLLDFTSKPYTERVFLNMGTGIAMFACKHKQLYRALLLEGDSFSEVVNEFLNILEVELTKDKRLTILSAAERRLLLQKMWTYTHGLASLICVGLIKDCNKEFIVNNLLDIGADVINSAILKHDNNNL